MVKERRTEAGGKSSWWDGLGDRLAAAAVSAFGVVLMLLLFLIADLKVSNPLLPLVWYSAHISTKALLGMVLAAALAGFFLGMERMAEFFGVVWGTNGKCGEQTPEDDELSQKIMFWVLLGVLLFLGWLFCSG